MANGLTFNNMNFGNVFNENKILVSPYPDLENDAEKIEFVIKELSAKNSIFDILQNLVISTESTDTKRNVTTYQKIEYAINTLKKYPNETECVVCDHEINSSILQEEKQQNYEKIKKY